MYIYIYIRFRISVVYLNIIIIEALEEVEGYENIHTKTYLLRFIAATACTSARLTEYWLWLWPSFLQQ